MSINSLMRRVERALIDRENHQKDRTHPGYVPLDTWSAECEKNWYNMLNVARDYWREMDKNNIKRLVWLMEAAEVCIERLAFYAGKEKAQGAIEEYKRIMEDSSILYYKQEIGQGIEQEYVRRMFQPH